MLRNRSRHKDICCNKNEHFASYHIKNVFFFLFTLNSIMCLWYLTKLITSLLRNGKLLKYVINNRAWNRSQLCQRCSTSLGQKFFLYAIVKKKISISHQGAQPLLNPNTLSPWLFLPNVGLLAWWGRIFTHYSNKSTAYMNSYLQ